MEGNINKRGFILTTSIAIILAVSILFMVGGLFVFASFNKFAVIGGGLVVLTLIFGFKGEFTQQKGIFMLLFISLGLFFIFGGGILQTTFQTPSHVFIDKDLGMITTAKQGGITQAIFKNKAGSGITVSNLGESVKVCDYILISSGYKYTEFHRITKLNGVQISSINWINSIPSSSGTFCSTFTPSKAGSYEVVTKYTKCPDVGVVRPEDCYTKSSDSVKSYYLEVKPIEERCNKVPYVANWYHSTNIENGKVMKQNVFKVTNDCTFIVNYKNVMTICDSGFLIRGSNLRQTEGDGWSCVAYVPPEPDEPDPIIVPECNIDLFVECGDGTIILAKTCTDGLYYDTGLECSIIGNDENEEDNRDTDGDGITDDLDNDDDNDGILDVDDDDKDGNGILDKDEGKGNFMQKFGYWVVGGFLALVVGILIFIGVKKK